MGTVFRLFPAMVYNTDYTVSGAEITMLKEADGTDTRD